MFAGLVACRQAFSNPQKLYDDTRARLERGELPQALKQSDEGTAQFQSKPEWAARFRVLKAEILIWQGKPKDASALLKEELPPELANDTVAIRRRLLRATAAYYGRRFDVSESEIAAAEQLASAHHPEMLGDVLLTRGTLTAVRGDYKGAAVLHRKALAILRREGRRFPEASALGNLGYDAMRQQHFDEAIDWFLQSSQVADLLKNQSLHERTLGNMGYCYERLGDFDRAEALYLESKETASKLGERLQELTWTNNLGNIARQRRNFNDAANYYQTSLAMARDIDSKSDMAIALNNLAAIALDTSDYDNAEKYNRAALEIKRSLGDKAAEQYSLLNDGRIAEGRKDDSRAIKVFSEVVANAAGDASLRWEAEAQMAEVFAAQGKTALAEARFRKGLSTIDAAREAVPREQSRLSFLNTADSFYNDYIDFLISHGRARDALAVTEHSRARTLAEGLKIPIEKVAFRPEETARKLKAVILAYWLKPGQSYLWAITPEKTAVYKLPAASEIDQQAQEYRKSLLSPLGLKRTSGERLYEMLIAPAQKLIKPNGRVIVIGHGSLHSLNFETLLIPGQDVHYWIEDATVSNASSISLLAAGAARRLPRSRDLLLIGDPNYSGSNYPALPQAKAEVDAVAADFPPTGKQVVEGDAATPRAYLSADLARFSYLHFVAHGTASRLTPLDSSIVLSPDSDGYKLYAREIMTKPLKAELVTVSACYGAGSQSYTGEGLVGLSWAFLRAGARNVIAASWQVSDASTPQLMQSMYSRLAKGEAPDVALREAKLEMLRSDSVYRRPFYWGAFQLYSGL